MSPRRGPPSEGALPLRLGPAVAIFAAGLLLATRASSPAQVRAAGGSRTAVPPATLTTASTVPTQIVLNWPSVDGAEGYRVTRSGGPGEPEATIYEGKAASFAVDRGMCGATLPCWFPDGHVSLGRVYAYRVASVFPGPVYSAPGPVARARSAPFLAPTNLTHAVVASTVKPGQLQVTVSWLPVVGAEGYFVVPTSPGLTATTVKTASVRFDPLRPGATYGLCVSAIYPLDIRDDTVRTCITVVL